MARVEAAHPLEGMRQPLVVRRELRQSFKSWLLRPEEQPPIVGREGLVDELSLLDLAKHYRLEYPGGARDLAAIWDESTERIADDGPTFKQLKDLGWVFFDGACWRMQSRPLGTGSHVGYPSPSTKTFLLALGKLRLVEKSAAVPSDVQELAAKILAEKCLTTHIPTRNPNWLARRLWEMLCPKPEINEADAFEGDAGAGEQGQFTTRDSPKASVVDATAVDSAFLEWSAWCSVLGVGRWDVDWASAAMQCCRDAACRVLERQELWLGWSEDSSRFADVLIRTFSIPTEQLRFSTGVQTVPPSLVFRHDWLAFPEVEHLTMERLGYGTVSFAFGLLCSELEETAIGPGITAAAAKVLAFAADHPMALQELLFRISNAPQLLVDMLMQPRTACLAAKLAIEWRPQFGRHNDRQLSRDAQTKEFAVQDALSFLAYHLDTGTIVADEWASLVSWCYGAGASSRQAVADSRKPIGHQILAMVETANEGVQSSVLQHLVQQAEYVNNVPRARFMGVLEAIRRLSSVSGVDTQPVAAVYARFARAMQLDWTDVPNLTPELAACLLAIAFAQTNADRDALLIPFNTVEVLKRAADEDRSSLTHSIARTMRVHVRLLARAVAGWSTETVPTELGDALRNLISLSAVEHIEKGKIGAITDRYSPIRVFTQEEGSPAFDLAAAWRRLNDSHKESVLQAFTVSDDPVLLSELCKHLPAAAKSRIQARLRQLTPDEASTFWTWPELSRRIEALLVAGEHELAREHLNNFREKLDTAPSEFRLNLFNLELRLHLNEKNWTALDGVVVPPKLRAVEAQQAQDYVNFYRATSQLIRPDGDLAAGRQMLRHLADVPGAPPVYQENAFALAIHQLMGPTLKPLASENRDAGESLLAEINACITANEVPASSNLLANRGMLLLALGRADEALDSVAARRRDAPSSDIELIAILAKMEQGLRDDAMAMLDAAIEEFGESEHFDALKRDSLAGKSVPSVAAASDTIDSIAHIRAALHQLSRLPPTDVGEVLGPPGGGFRIYLARQVSRSVAMLQNMAAMLRDRKNEESEARFENDLNTAVRTVLQASLDVAKWNVNDQSLGGATRNKNAGERDAVIVTAHQELAIYEALVCDSVRKDYIRQHFHKLVPYGVCDIYFHVIYSYANILQPTFEYVRHMLEHEVPGGLTYVDCKTLEPPDYATSGYLATYRADYREIAIVFFIADLKARGALE